MNCAVSAWTWPSSVSVTVSVADISDVRVFATGLALALVFERVSTSYFGSEGLSLRGLF